MKVIGGSLKGRNLLFLKNKNVRPTRDMVREAIFDVLRGRVENEKVLDLFAGTGAVGIEALSQGAGEAVFVEPDLEAYRVIKSNLESLGISGRCRVIRGNAEKVIFSLRDGAFGLVIADPPYGYASKKAESLLSSLVALNIVRSGGMAVFEHKEKNGLQVPTGMHFYREKRYGKTVVSYFLRD